MNLDVTVIGVVLDLGDRDFAQPFFLRGSRQIADGGVLFVLVHEGVLDVHSRVLLGVAFPVGIPGILVVRQGVLEGIGNSTAHAELVVIACIEDTVDKHFAIPPEVTAIRGIGTRRQVEALGVGYLHGVFHVQRGISRLVNRGEYALHLVGTRFLVVRHVNGQPFVLVGTGFSGQGQLDLVVVIRGFIQYLLKLGVGGVELVRAKDVQVVGNVAVQFIHLQVLSLADVVQHVGYVLGVGRYLVLDFLLGSVLCRSST